MIFTPWYRKEKCSRDVITIDRRSQCEISFVLPEKIEWNKSSLVRWAASNCSATMNDCVVRAHLTNCNWCVLWVTSVTQRIAERVPFFRPKWSDVDNISLSPFPSINCKCRLRGLGSALDAVGSFRRKERIIEGTNKKKRMEEKKKKKMKESRSEGKRKKTRFCTSFGRRFQTGSMKDDIEPRLLICSLLLPSEMIDFLMRHNKHYGMDEKGGKGSRIEEGQE